MKKAIFLSSNPKQLQSVYNDEKIKQIYEIVDLYDDIIPFHALQDYASITKEAEIIFSTWGMPSLSREMIDTYFPKLKIVFYAAGSVQGFAESFLQKGIQVASAYKANAIPTAEYAACQIVLANKGYFRAAMLTKQDGNFHAASFVRQQYPGNYATKVGILGAGAVGSHVIQLLKQMNLQIEISVFDPFLPDHKAIEMGVTKCTLEEIYATCQTISNHLANNEQTRNMLHKTYFDLMLDTATFINTGRGQQVVEEDLIQALKAKPNRCAVLDVTYPEPPQQSSELYTLPNVILTPHIAGSFGNEVYRMADYMIEECTRWLENKKLAYEITLDQLKTMA